MSSTQEAASEPEVRSLKLPRVSEAPPKPDTQVNDHNPVFSLLVQSETDTTGLLAYALYKQNKRDWLIAHKARDGREPTKAELDAYILGESIPRRIATYRRLAEDQLASETIESRKPGILTGLMATPANDPMPARASAGTTKTITWKYIAFLLAMLVLMAILFRITAGWLFGPR